MARTAVLATAICLASLLSNSTAHAARFAPPNQFVPLTPEQRKEVERRTFYLHLALGGLGVVLVLGAIGQLVYSIRNFRQESAEEKKSRHEELTDDLSQAFGSPDDDFDEADEAVDDTDLQQESPSQPIQRVAANRAPCGIIANHIDRLDP